MKKFTFLFALVLLFSANSIAQRSTGPVLETARDSYNYGTITKGSNGEAEFTITNSGDQDLIISECQPSCDCISIKCPATAIAPGSTVTIRIVYDTNKLGNMNNTIILTSNAVNTNTTNAGTYRLTVQGEVIQATSPGLKK